MIIDDLKQSVQLKITVADDLQNILKQSQEQYHEMKKDNKELATEKELMISKFWQAESVSSQLQEMNKQLFIEIDNL